MTDKLDALLIFKDGLSRRTLFGSVGLAALAGLPRTLLAQTMPAQPGMPSAHPIAEPDINWKLECRWAAGGAPYRPALMAMFYDALFFQIHVGPTDLGPTGSPSVGPRVGGGAGGGGRARGGGGAAGAAAPGAPGAAAPGGRGAATSPTGAGQVTGAPVRGAGAAPPPGSGPEAFSPVAIGPTGNAPLNAATTEPNDLPIIPSGGVRVGISTITSSSPSVQLLNDQTNWAEASRTQTENAWKANQELIGVVVFHNAIGDNQDWPLWYQEITGGQVVLADRADAKKSTITKNATFDVKAVGSHPIVQDFPAFRVTGEEAYKGMWQAPNIVPLVEATGAATDRVVAWVGPNPTKARVVNLAFGTSSETLRNMWYRRLVRNAVLWAGHRLD